MEIVETDPEVETEDEIVTGAETEEETGTGVEIEEGETGVTPETTGESKSFAVNYFCIFCCCRRRRHSSDRSDD